MKRLMIYENFQKQFSQLYKVKESEAKLVIPTKITQGIIHELNEKLEKRKLAVIQYIHLIEKNLIFLDQINREFFKQNPKEKEKELREQKKIQ